MRALQYTVIYAKSTSYTSICTSTQVYRQSFRPLAYSFSKAIESTEAVRMVMDGLQIVALKYFGRRLRPTVSISDHSEGLRTGMAHILTSRPLGEVPEETELPLPHLGDWAHIAHLVCTCKSSRSTTLCSHIIAITALCVPGTYTIDYLKSLLENLAPKGKKAAHRPGNTLGGQRIQPQGDSEAESDSDGEDDDEGYSGDEDDPGPATERAERAEAEAAGLDEASESEPETEPPSEPESSDSGSDTEPPSEAE